MNIKKSVKVMSARTGFTQKQLSERLKITPQYLSKIMRDNKFVRQDRLSEMASFYGVPVSEFIMVGE